MNESAPSASTRPVSHSTLLRQRGATIDVKNHGRWLIVRHGGRVFNYWPRTRTWSERNMCGAYSNMAEPLRKGQGLNTLLAQLEPKR
jgi:hypothetical protein